METITTKLQGNDELQPASSYTEQSNLDPGFPALANAFMAVYLNYISNAVERHFMQDSHFSIIVYCHF